VQPIDSLSRGKMQNNILAVEKCKKNMQNSI